MESKYSKEDLESLLIKAPKKTRQNIQKLIKLNKKDYFEFETDDEWGFAAYIVAKKCPVETHACGWIDDDGNSSKCAHYNAFKEKCVYPRTCIHNHNSDNDIGLDDGFSGNLQRYCNPKDGKGDEEQILQKGKELRIFDKDFKEATYGWEYAEFEDDGKKITLVELVSEENVRKVLEKRKQGEAQKLIEERNQMKSELTSLLNKYSGDNEKDIKRAVELTKKLIPPSPFFTIDF